MALSSCRTTVRQQLLYIAAAAVAGAVATHLSSDRACAQSAIIGVPVSLSGFSAPAGRGVAEAAQLAAEEANLDTLQPRVELRILDDESSPEKAAGLARQLVTGEAIAIVGPGTTQAALAGGPIYAQGGLAAIVPYAHGAAVSNSTTFLTTFDSTEMGSLLAGYLRHALGRERPW
jgi:ABC-type branched-subunit amino acid transport system substrate-binding protein